MERSRGPLPGREWKTRKGSAKMQPCATRAEVRCIGILGVRRTRQRCGLCRGSFFRSATAGGAPALFRWPYRSDDSCGYPAPDRAARRRPRKGSSRAGRAANEAGGKTTSRWYWSKLRITREYPLPQSQVMAALATLLIGPGFFSACSRLLPCSWQHGRIGSTPQLDSNFGLAWCVCREAGRSVRMRSLPRSRPGSGASWRYD